MTPQIIAITTEIGKFLSEPYDNRHPDDVLNKLTLANSYLGKIAWAMAESNKLIAPIIAAAARKYSDDNITRAKMFITADVANDQYYVDILNYQNDKLNYLIKSLITNVSYLKTEMENLP